jgi:hypothetical protein
MAYRVIQRTDSIERTSPPSLSFLFSPFSVFGSPFSVLLSPFSFPICPFPSLLSHLSFLTRYRSQQSRHNTHSHPPRCDAMRAHDRTRAPSQFSDGWEINGHSPSCLLPPPRRTVGSGMLGQRCQSDVLFLFLFFATDDAAAAGICITELCSVLWRRLRVHGCMSA